MLVPRKRNSTYRGLARSPRCFGTVEGASGRRVPVASRKRFFTARMVLDARLRPATGHYRAPTMPDIHRCLGTVIAAMVF